MPSAIFLGLYVVDVLETNFVCFLGAVNVRLSVYAKFNFWCLSTHLLPMFIYWHFIVQAILLEIWIPHVSDRHVTCEIHFLANC